MKNKFQTLINLLVLAMVVVLVWPLVSTYFWYEDETYPDEIRLLDETIDVFLETVDPDFQALLDPSNPVNELTDGGKYEFKYLSSPVTLSTAQNYAQSVDSLVYLTTSEAGGWLYVSTGSIVTKDGLILTNYHVIEAAEKIVVTTNDGVNHTVSKVVAYDPDLDIAWLKIDAVNLTPLPIGNVETVEVGDETVAIGHSEGFINSVSTGNVSGFRDYYSRNAGRQMQITNPISEGNSGGALLNTKGELIGVPTWSLGYSANSVQVQNINFAVPIDEALKLLNF